MQISSSHRLRIECPECNAEFERRIWNTIDRKERPDLWDQCRLDRIQLWRCPASHPGRVSGPLLMHDSDRELLLYSPRPNTGREPVISELEPLLTRFARQVPESYLRKLLGELEIFRPELLPLGMAGADKETISAIGDMHELLSSGLSSTSPKYRAQVCRRAITLFRKDDAPALWAIFANRLSIALFNDMEGDRTSNLEDAIATAKAATDVFEPEADPVRWALGMSNLALLYLNRMDGDASDNMEIAIKYARSSLSILGRRSFPQLWATAQQNLGNALLSRKRGESNRNKRESIAVLTAAAEIITAEADPKAWASIHQNIGVAWFKLGDGTLAENIENAIAAYHRCLETRTPETAPLEWILTQMDLGNAYLHRIEGERADNYELAVETYEEAASVARERGFTFQWARLEYDLCNAYLSRIRGRREDNLEKALGAGFAAASVLTKEAHPDEYGRLQQNLGNVYLQLSRTGDQRAADLDRSIAAYSEALSVRTPDSFPVEWLQAIDSLSAAYAERDGENIPQDRERSLELLEQARGVNVRGLSPRTHVTFLLNLGTAYRDRYRQGKSEYRTKAVEVFSEAYELSLELRLYEVLRVITLRLAEMRFEAGEWRKAHDELSATAALIEEGYVAAITTEGKEAEAETNWLIYQMLCEVSLVLCRPRDAFLHAEESRSRALRDEIRTITVPPPNVNQSTLDCETRLLELFYSLQVAIMEAETAADRRCLFDEVGRVRVDLQNTWAELSKYPGGSNYVALRRGERLQWQEIADWTKTRVQQTALIEYFTLRNRVIAFVIRSGELDPHVVELPVTHSQLLELALSQVPHLYSPAESREASAASELGLALIAPLVPHLTGVAAVCIASHGILNYIPLHALEHLGKPLAEYAAVSYVPSIAMAIRMRAARGPNKAHGRDQLTVVGNPTSDLPFAQTEAMAIARMFGVVPLLEAQACKGAILEALKSTPSAHIAAHAYFDSRDPFDSGIITHGREVLRARDLMAHSIRPQLIVLSGCETGVQRINPGENHAGLTRALLYAGVNSLVVSLWSVADFASLLLMHRFYLHLSEGRPLDTALQRAQLWLRSAPASEIAAWFNVERERSPEEALMDYGIATNAWRYFVARPPNEQVFCHPFFWAGFVLVGAT
jgi:CHAT domain-containing protein/tetratricopeptide (TPR) repeat protein